MSLQKFRNTLDQGIMYMVTNSEHYTHCLPSNMTVQDLNELYERYKVRGKDSILENHKVYSSLLLS